MNLWEHPLVQLTQLLRFTSFTHHPLSHMCERQPWKQYIPVYQGHHPSSGCITANNTIFLHPFPPFFHNWLFLPLRQLPLSFLSLLPSQESWRKLCWALITNTGIRVAQCWWSGGFPDTVVVMGTIWWLYFSQKSHPLWHAGYAVCTACLMQSSKLRVFTLYMTSLIGTELFQFWNELKN